MKLRAYRVTVHKGGGWRLVLTDGGQRRELVFPAGEAGEEQAIDAGLAWVCGDERGMGLHSPMEAAGGS